MDEAEARAHSRRLTIVHPDASGSQEEIYRVLIGSEANIGSANSMADELIEY